jgi:hypothetical protein
MNIEPLWALVGIVITVAGSVFGARYAGKSSVKVKELDVDGQAYLRAQGINAEIVAALREELAGIRGRLEKVEDEMAEVRDHNNALITFAYRLVSLARKYGHESEIPTPPPHGIHL